MKGGCFAAVFMVNVVHRRRVHVVLLHREELSIGRGAQPHALLRARAMPDGLKHHLATDNKLHWLAKVPRGSCGERAMCPREKLTAEPRTDKLRDDADVFLR